MKKILLLFVLLASLGNAQPGCNSTVLPNDICYPAQTMNIPTTKQSDAIYLCGPGAVVYDTLDPLSLKLRIVYINAGCVYHYKSTLATNALTLWAKNGSNVIIYAGTIPTSTFTVYQETGATITNLSTNTLAINNCTAITGPPVTCSPTGISNLLANDTQTSVWPNPANDKLFITSESFNDKTISIINLLGDTVYSLKGIKNEKQEISLNAFVPGIYYVVIKCDGNSETKKIVVIR
mgnify:CR=1 FL=1